MKQHIPLTPHNIEILKTHGATDQELQIEYWIKFIMTNEDQMKLVFKNRSIKDIQVKIKTRANKLLKKFIRNKLGLPSTSGSMTKQKLYAKILKQKGIEQ